MYDIYNDKHSDAVLLVDDENAFNSINKNVMLINIYLGIQFNYIQYNQKLKPDK